MIKNYKKSLIEPLNKGELHIFHSSSSLDRCIKEIFEIIQEEVHGSYLIGGLRGVGKTSLINLCCAKYRYKDLLRIDLNCSKMIDVDNFIYFFIEELQKSVKSTEISNEIIDEIEDMSMKIINNHSKKAIYECDNKSSNNKSVDESNEKNIDVNFNLFSTLFNISNKLSRKSSRFSSTETNMGATSTQEIEERNDHFILVERLSNVLKKIATHERKYRIVITVDELDKHDRNFIEELFDYYKNLFLNSHIITFFIVDLLKYIDFRNGNEIENKLLSYIIKSIYIPTLEHEDVKAYMYREFEIKNYKDIIEIDYLTYGILRKMNTYKYQEDYNRKYTFAKSILYYDIVSTERQDSFLERHAYDVYKFFVRKLIENVFRERRISSKYICECFDETVDKYNVSMNHTKFIIDKFDDLVSKYNFLTCNQGENGEKEYVLDINNLEEYKLLDNYKMKKIKYELYSHRYYKINKSIYKKDLLPINISEHKTEAFYYIIRFLETMAESIDNVIVVEQVSNWGRAEVLKYSAILVIDKPIGSIIYTINECSFSYEGPFTVEKLTAFMRENKIKVIKVETDDEAVEKNLEYIFKKADEIILGKEGIK